MNESFLTRSLAKLALLVVFCSLLAYLAPYINPKKVWLPAFFGLAFPVLLILNIGFGAWGFFFRIRTFYICLLCLLIGSYHLLGLVNFSIPLPATENSLKVMSYNVRYFRILDIKDLKKRQEAQDKQLAIIKAQAPDILCVQEFSGDRDLASTDRARNYLETSLGMKNLVSFRTIRIFAKNDALEVQKIRFENSNNAAVCADIKLKNGQSIRIINAHLQSIRFAHEDLDAIENIEQHKFKDKRTWQKARSIARKLKTAYQMRADQSEQLRSLIETSPYPVILCGDFNDTPSSYAYRNLNLQLQDAFKRKGRGIGSTYNGPIPFQRIDYVMASEQFKIQQYKTIKRSSSDHRAVVVTMELKND